MSNLMERYEAVHGQAKAALDDGACVLPPEPVEDYWGSLVPSYEMVMDAVGSPGSIANAEAYEAE